MKKLLILIVYLSVSFLGSPIALGHDLFIRVSSGKTVSFEQVVRDIKKADLVFVGELHDNTDHHRVQLDIIKALDTAGIPVAVGLEMFRANSQKELDRWVRGKSGVKRFRAVYDDNWRIEWPLYRDIFFYAKKSRIPMIGLNVSPEITQKVARGGFSSLSRKDVKKLPPGISCSVDKKYMEFIRRAYTAHGHDERSFVYFCEAQMVWDKTMAWHLVEFKKKHPDTTVIVLAGAGHSWKRCIPEQVKRQSKLSYKVILPYIPERGEENDITTRDADYLFTQ